MSSKRCPKCGHVNYSFEDQCKKCGRGLADSAVVASAPRQRPPRSKDCPHCRSAETRSFEMAYATSTSTGTLVASSYNFGGGGFTMTGGNINQQSALAAYVRPPIKPTSSNDLIIGAGILGGCAGLVLLFILANAGFFPIGVVMLLVLPIGAALLVNPYATRINAGRWQAYQAALQQWQRYWICLRCGNRWAI